MYRTNRRSASSLVAIACLAAFLASTVPLFLGGCQIYRNEHDFQDSPHAPRLTTIPQGARVIIQTPRLGKIELYTPCDLPAELRKTDVISVTKDGYLSWRGELGELPQMARANFKLEMRPIVPTE